MDRFIGILTPSLLLLLVSAQSLSFAIGSDIIQECILVPWFHLAAADPFGQQFAQFITHVNRHRTGHNPSASQCKICSYISVSFQHRFFMLSDRDVSTSFSNQQGCEIG